MSDTRDFVRGWLRKGDSDLAARGGALWQWLDAFVLVEDDELLQAIMWMTERAHTLAEGAGAAPLAAAYQLRATFEGKKVGLVCSGGNISLDHLRHALNATKDT